MNPAFAKNRGLLVPKVPKVRTVWIAWDSRAVAGYRGGVDARHGTWYGREGQSGCACSLAVNTSLSGARPITAKEAARLLRAMGHKKAAEAAERE